MKQATRRQVDSTEILRFAAIVESSEDAIVGEDLNGIVESWNPAAEKLYGYSAEEMSGRPMSLLLPSDRPDEESGFLRAIRRGERIRRFETVRARKSGEPIDVSIAISPVADSSGTIVGALHTARDVTGSRQFESRMQRLQKLEGLAALAGGIAQDFNRLLGAMLGNVSLALDALPHDSPAREAIAGIERSARRASALTRQVLAYAGKGRFVVESLDLSEVVKEIAPLAEASIPRNVRLHLEVDSSQPLIRGDSSQLQQVLMNLIANAAEAVGDGDGSIVVRTGGQVIDEHCIVAGSSLAAGEYAVLEVQDTGRGMDEATQAKIFDPFFTTHAAGRGLGLAAVMGIVRAHRGALKVLSAPGQGSTFKVLLPAAFETAIASEKAKPALQVRGRILVADDEELIRTFAKAALEYFGYVVTLARDGQEAIDLFARAPDAFGLVFLDLTMPVINGEEVFRRLQEIRPGVPVLLSSGFDEASAIRKFSGQGPSGFVQKPYSTKILAESVRATLSSRGS